jgi:hypothetical protein
MKQFKFSRAEGATAFGTLQTDSITTSLSATTEKIIDIPEGAGHIILTVQPGAMLIYKTDKTEGPSIVAPDGGATVINSQQSATTGTRETWGFNDATKLHLYADKDAWVIVEFFTYG